MSKRTVLLSVTVIALVSILFGAATNTINWTQLVSGDRHGTQTKGQASDGTGASGHLATYNADGSLTDGGAPATNTSALVLLAEITASASTSVDFTTRNVSGQSGTIFQSDFDDYHFRLSNVLAATSTANLTIVAGTGGGPTWDTGTNYLWALFASNSSAATGATGNAADTSIQIASSLNTNANWGVNGQLQFGAPGSTSVFKQITGQTIYFQSTAVGSQASFGAAYKSTTAVTGLRFIMSSGNITSGTIRAYGVSK